MSNYSGNFHRLLAALPAESLPLAKTLQPAAPQLIIVTDRIDRYQTYPRIVYVGFSSQSWQRCRQLFYTKQSHLRAYLAAVLPDERACTDYIERHFQVQFLTCADQAQAKQLAQQLLAHLQGDPHFQPSSTWIGHGVKNPPLSQTKVWQNFTDQSLEWTPEVGEQLQQLIIQALEQVATNCQDLAALQRAAVQFQSQTMSRWRTEWVRNPYVKAYVLQKAQGICELCEQPAPFRLPNGEPYLEVHHLQPLATGGADTIANCAALCPNCHRAIHYTTDKEIIEYLRKQQKRTE